MKELCDFLREKRQLLFFLLFFEGALCLIYGLYGLPWGPAGYTCLVTAVVTLGFLMAGFFRWERKRRQLLILKRQAEQSLETADLPKAETPLEKIYQEIIQDQEKRCQREQKESREKLVRSREYYTRWSHQIKTPIAAMELLLQEEPADVRALKRELLKTSQYVEMALSYQRMEGDGNDLVIQRYELRPVVMQAVKKVSPLLIHKHISFSAGDLSGEVLTDEKWLVFVLEQLLTNASQYTKEGGSVRIGRGTGGNGGRRDRCVGESGRHAGNGGPVRGADHTVPVDRRVSLSAEKPKGWVVRRRGRWQSNRSGKNGRH